MKKTSIILCLFLFLFISSWCSSTQNTEQIIGSWVEYPPLFTYLQNSPSHHLIIQGGNSYFQIKLQQTFLNNQINIGGDLKIIDAQQNISFWWFITTTSTGNIITLTPNITATGNVYIQTLLKQVNNQNYSVDTNSINSIITHIDQDVQQIKSWNILTNPHFSWSIHTHPYIYASLSSTLQSWTIHYLISSKQTTYTIKQASQTISIHHTHHKKTQQYSIKSQHHIDPSRNFDIQLKHNTQNSTIYWQLVIPTPKGDYFNKHQDLLFDFKFILSEETSWNDLSKNKKSTKSMN